jgi:hypothetical protein
LSPYELAEGVSPLAKWKHMPYFLGEFDREGRLKDPKDPFLYWYLPIAKVPEGYDQPQVGVPTITVNIPLEKGKRSFLLDCLKLHAAGRYIPQPENRVAPQEKK